MDILVSAKDRRTVAAARDDGNGEPQKRPLRAATGVAPALRRRRSPLRMSSAQGGPRPGRPQPP
ncbi:hypothetical protein [Xanthomonas graminis]|uniref:hypothetical protein n=1 Tax=Xanthomonas graminis TaxID=3390026 RepID=UPI000A4E3048|nr:hypothetical protein [Xanthomonas translucens]UKE64970.1 hypothetical protein KM547_14820 [Xanthomonas translucens pv. phlei]UKE74240.1 hypothetical protein KFS85_04790 [Xanthomonas translucens pv. phleipratensis]